MFSEKQIAWVIEYNEKYNVFNVNRTKRTVRWLQPLNMDVTAFNNAGLDIWDKRLRKAVSDTVKAQMA